MEQFIVLSGSSNPELAKEICNRFDLTLGTTDIKRFSDSETSVKLGGNTNGNLRNRSVFIIQSTCRREDMGLSSNDTLMELILMIDAAKRSSAKEIIAVIPYFGYGRQDRKTEAHVPISAAVIADMIKNAGAKKIITIDLHASQIQGFFNGPLDNLYARPIFMDFIKQHIYSKEEKIVIVSPDAGGAEMARSYAKRLPNPQTDIALIDKRRPKANETEIMHIIGDVKGKTAIIIDDMMDTGGTMVKAAEAIMGKEAKKVISFCTHGVLSGPAIERLNNSPIEKIFFTDSIYLSEDAKKCKKIHILSAADMLGRAIKRSHEGRSVHSLFE